VKVEVNELGYDYNGFKALNDIKLSFSEGRVIGLLGPNGCGKTTLLKCISGILSPSNGEILINGIDIENYSKKELAKIIGYVPQAEEINFSITVFDTILMGRKPYIGWKPSEKDLEIVRELIDHFELNELAMRGIDELSGGQRQKVILARALAQKPGILVLDEPTNNLDIKHQVEMLEVAQRKSREDVLVLVAIHDLNLASRYCDRVIMMKDGEVHAEGRDEVLVKEIIEPVYDVKIDIHEINGEKIIIPSSNNGSRNKIRHLDSYNSP